MRRHIYWMHHDTDAEFVARAFERLERLFVRHRLAISLSKVPSGKVAEIEDYLTAGSLDLLVAELPTILDDPNAGLSVHCLPESAAARVGRGRLPTARWGYSTRGVLSLTYGADNPFILWHETLHLLGASDHYDTRTLATTCDTPTCLMQYAPGEETVREENCLCARTLATLRNAQG
jgi:hypothetical protein